MTACTGDEEIVRLAQEGDREAFARLFEKYRYEIFRYAQQILRNKELAWDTVQDTFIYALRGLASYRSDNFSAWLHRIARNAALNLVRYMKYRTAPSTDQPTKEVVDPTPNQADLLETKKERESMLRKINGLPPDHRDLILLRFYEDQSYEEMAEMAEVPLGTIMSRLNRAKISLRKRLAKAA